MKGLGDFRRHPQRPAPRRSPPRGQASVICAKPRPQTAGAAAPKIRIMVPPPADLIQAPMEGLATCAIDSRAAHLLIMSAPSRSIRIFRLSAYAATASHATSMGPQALKPSNPQRTARSAAVPLPTSDTHFPRLPDNLPPAPPCCGGCSHRLQSWEPSWKRPLRRCRPWTRTWTRWAANRTSMARIDQKIHGIIDQAVARDLASPANRSQ